jgi:hypothetical protein
MDGYNVSQSYFGLCSNLRCHMLGVVLSAYGFFVSGTLAAIMVGLLCWTDLC